MSDALALHIENLSVNYRHTPALTDVCLDVREGEFLGIIGPNGGGKSSLLKAILGLIPISTGKISIFGEDYKKRTRPVGYVPQFAEMDRSFPVSALEVVMMAYQQKGLHPFFRFTEEHKRGAREKMEQVGIGELAERQISELSGGEFQRLLIARALAVEPRLLLLDEPTASVDPASRQKIYDLLSQVSKTVTIILVTHDMFAISSQVNSLACMNGTLVYHGEPDLTQEVVHEMYGCQVDIIAHGVPHRVLPEHDGACCGGGTHD